LLWIVGLVSFVWLLVSLKNEIKYQNHTQEISVALQNPKADVLNVRIANTDKYYNRSWLKLEPFAVLNSDSVFVSNYTFRIEQSTNDSFSVHYVGLSNGRTPQQALQLANEIHFNAIQRDSFLFIDKGININTTHKFRNQHVIVTLVVPIGKRFMISDKQTWNTRAQITFGNDIFWDNPYDIYNDSYEYDSDREYIMTKHGPKPIHPLDQKHKEDEEKVEL
jgi:hypothetical protein